MSLTSPKFATATSRRTRSDNHRTPPVAHVLASSISLAFAFGEISLISLLVLSPLETLRWFLVGDPRFPPSNSWDSFQRGKNRRSAACGGYSAPLSRQRHDLRLLAKAANRNAATVGQESQFPLFVSLGGWGESKRPSAFRWGFKGAVPFRKGIFPLVFYCPFAKGQSLSQEPKTSPH